MFRHRPLSALGLLVAITAISCSLSVAGCSQQNAREGVASQSNKVTPGGAECYFDCSAWDSSTFGAGANAPRVFQKALGEGAYVGAPGTNVNGVCVPQAMPEKVKSFVTSAPPSPGALPSASIDTGVDPKDSAPSDSAVVASFRYACMADGYMLDKNAASTPDERDVQSFFEEECVAAGACPSTDISSDEALGSAPAQPGGPGGGPGAPGGPDAGGPEDPAPDPGQADSCAGKADGVYCSAVNEANAYVCAGEQIASEQQCAAEQQCIGPNGAGTDIECADMNPGFAGSPGAPRSKSRHKGGASRYDRHFVEHYIEAAAQRRNSLRTRQWDPNEHAPTGWLGRRIVAHITEGPCQAFNGLDQLISRLNNRWGVYASYGASGGAGGALKFSAAYAYDMRNFESSAYIDAGVNIGFNASISLSAARGMTIGGDDANYDSIHNFFGGAYVGANGNVATPFVRVGVGMQISTCTPALHPWTLEVSATFGISGTPFEANATTGAIIPVNIGTRRLRGITQGWVNVFDDEYGEVAFGGVGNNFNGNYERMRNSPDKSDIWKAGSMANSAVRFANAHDLAALFIFRAAFEQAWAGMRAACR